MVASVTTFRWPDGHSAPTSIVAVDQTGAVLPGGRAKPLCTAVFDCASGQLTTNLRLRALNRAAVTEIVPASSPRVLVLVDAVLGLPEALDTPFDALLERAAQFTWDGKKLGRGTAAQFFRQWLPESEGPRPTRLAEELAGANSVFLQHPFQRNIGCGTFRILKDLSAGERWFSLWPHEKEARHRFVLAEGYPSHCWRAWLRAPRRRLSLLEAHLREHFPAADLPRSHDDGDAIALALGGAHFVKAGALDAQGLPGRAFVEGWIFGLDPSAAIVQR